MADAARRSRAGHRHGGSGCSSRDAWRGPPAQCFGGAARTCGRRDDVACLDRASRRRMTDYGHHRECGVFVAPSATSADQVVAVSALAEEAGYELVTFSDHPYSPRSLDTWTLMSFVAARTE